MAAAQHTVKVKEPKRKPKLTGRVTDNSSEDRALRQCWVCGEESSTYHYGIVSCDGCKSFFSRSQSLHTTYKCDAKKCVVNKVTRNQCQYCRWIKCQEVGMSKEACKLGRRSRKLKEQMIEKGLKLQKYDNSPESSSRPNNPSSFPEQPVLLKQEHVTQEYCTSEKAQGCTSENVHIKEESSGSSSKDYSCTKEKSVAVESTPEKAQIKEEVVASSSKGSCIKEKSIPSGSASTSSQPDLDCSETKDLEKTEPSGQTKTCDRPNSNRTRGGKALRKSRKLKCHEMSNEDIINQVLNAQIKTFTIKHVNKKDTFIKDREERAKEGQPSKGPTCSFLEGSHSGSESQEKPSGSEQPKIPSNEIWQNVSAIFSDLIEGVVAFAKLLPGFTELELDERMSIIKTGCFEVVTIRNSMLHDPVMNTIEIYGTDIKMTVGMASSTPMGDFVLSLFDFAMKINSLSLNDTEKALISAVTLMSPDRPGLSNKGIVSSCQALYLSALQHELSVSHPENTTLLSQILLLLPKLREINCEHSKRLMEMQMVHQVQFPPLHQEVFNL
ncbi:thyroid hormone receptor beta-A-like [Glandiceps talaboti]